MTKKKIDFTANLFAFLYSLAMFAVFGQYLRFGFLGLGKVYALFSSVGILLVLLCCASFFLLANRRGDTGIYWLVSGLFLNGTLTYVFLLLWKLSYVFFFTSVGQMIDIRLSSGFLLGSVMMYSMSYLMMCFGIYEILRKGQAGPLDAKSGAAADKL